jgi:hypothetical protein
MDWWIGGRIGFGLGFWFPDLLSLCMGPQKLLLGTQGLWSGASLAGTARARLGDAPWARSGFWIAGLVDFSFHFVGGPGRTDGRGGRRGAVTHSPIY